VVRRIDAAEKTADGRRYCISACLEWSDCEGDANMSAKEVKFNGDAR